MKQEMFILVLIISVAALACDKDVAYTSQASSSVKAVPVKPLVDPCALSDGSIVTITADSTFIGKFLFPPYFLTKISTDGTVTSAEIKDLYAKTIYYNELKLTTNGNDDIFVENCWQYHKSDILKFDKDLNLIFQANALQCVTTGAPLRDGGYAMFASNEYGEGPQNDIIGLKIFDGGGQAKQEITQCSLLRHGEGLSILKTSTIGDDRIIFYATQNSTTNATFRIYTLDGKIKRYGELKGVTGDDIRYRTKLFSIGEHLYAAMSDTTFKSCRITKLGVRHDTVFSKVVDISYIFSITQQDGMITIVGPAGPFLPQKKDSPFGYVVSRIKPYLSDITGKIITMDPSNGEIANTTTISLEGSTVPYAATAAQDGYNVMMSRIFADDINGGIEWLYNDKIYAYHVDDLKQLQLTQKEQAAK